MKVVGGEHWLILPVKRGTMGQVNNFFLLCRSRKIDICCSGYSPLPNCYRTYWSYRKQITVRVYYAAIAFIHETTDLVIGIKKC